MKQSIKRVELFRYTEGPVPDHADGGFIITFQCHIKEKLNKFCLLKLIYNLILTQNIRKIKTKRNCIFLLVEKMSKMAKFKMAANVYKN